MGAIFLMNGCSFLAIRKIPNRGHSLYFATALRNIAICFEVSLANSGACRIVVKSKDKYLSYVACQTAAKLVNTEYEDEDEDDESSEDENDEDEDVEDEDDIDV